MGKCPNCGRSGFFLKTVKCKVCRKEGCDKCFIDLIPIITSETSDKPDFTPYELAMPKLYACSTECMESYKERLKKQMERMRKPQARRGFPR